MKFSLGLPWEVELGLQAKPERYARIRLGADLLNRIYWWKQFCAAFRVMLVLHDSSLSLDMLGFREKVASRKFYK